MPRERPTLATYGTDGPLLAAILDVLFDIHDLLEERVPSGADPGPSRISEPAPDRPRRDVVPVPDEDDEEPAPVAEPAPDLPEPPPRAGRGSSATAWAAWAETAHVATTADMSRDDIIHACQSAGVLPDS